MLGQPVNLEYKPGAGGNVAANFAISAPADGHTLLFGHAGPLAINHHINKSSFFDPARDLIPINLSVGYPIVITVQPDIPVSSILEFVGMSKKADRELIFGSSGNGSIQHLSGEMFKRHTGLKFLHVPFAGGGPLQKAFLSGQLQVIFETGSNVIENYKAGKMKPLAVMATERLAVLPNVPTLAEAGYPNLLSEAWFGFLTTKSTPQSAIDKLDGAITAALKDPEVREQLTQLGARIINGGQKAFAAYIAEQDKYLGQLVKEVGVKPD